LQPTKFGVGVLENKEQIMNNTHKNGVFKKKNRMKSKGQTMKNLSNFKLDCPNKLQIFSSTFTIVVSKGE